MLTKKKVSAYFPAITQVFYKNTKRLSKLAVSISAMYSEKLRMKESTIFLFYHDVLFFYFLKQEKG